MNGWAGPGASEPETSGSAASLHSSAAESILMPSTPRENQNRSTSSKSRRTSAEPQLKSGCSGANKCRYHSPFDPSGSVTRVQAGPPKIDCQLFGGSSPETPRPARNQNRDRAAEPGPAASAATNHGCRSEEWLGTTSTMILIPCACASAMSASASASVPKTGSIDR